MPEVSAVHEKRRWENGVCTMIKKTKLGKSREFMMILAGVIDIETCLNSAQRSLKELQESLNDSRKALDKFDAKFGGVKYMEGKTVEEDDKKD